MRHFAPALTRSFLALAFVACVPALAHAQLKQIRQVEGITEYALPNGLTVLVAPDPSKPTTTINITYRVGSRHEGYGETGAAHLLEHMLFKETDNIADPKKEMAERGARWNGTTNVDRTNYFAQFATNDATMDWTLGWLAEAMTRAKVLRRDLDSEMTVVRNEMERGENQPVGVLYGQMLATAYQWHGYGRDTIGARSDVENIPIERLQAFYRTHYRPDNAVLFIGGKFNQAEALKKVEAAFGAIAKPANGVPRTYTLDPAQEGARDITLRRTGGVGTVLTSYHTVPGSHADQAAFAALATMLGRPEGVLDREITKKGLAVSQFAATMSRAEPGNIVFGLNLPQAAPDTPEQEQAARQALDALIASVQNAAQNGTLTANDFDIARQALLQNHKRAMQEPEALGLAVSEAVALGDWRLMFAMRDALEALTLADVQRVARDYLVSANRTSGVYLPSAKPITKAPAPALVNLDERMKSFKPRVAAAEVQDYPFTPENIDARVQQRQLAVGGQPGLKVVVLPRETKENRVSGSLALRWGTVNTVADVDQAADLAGPLLMRGTPKYTADQITQKLLGMEGTLRFASSAQGVGASFSVPAKNLDALLALMVEILQTADFKDVEFERVKKEALVGAQAAKTEPNALANEAIGRVFNRHYPRNDVRRFQTMDEEIANLERTQVADVRAYWKRFGGATTGELALVGPVSIEKIAPQVEALMGAWTGSEPYKSALPTHPTTFEPMRQAMTVPDKANATYVGMIPLAMNDDSPDYPALVVATYLLGNGPSSDLWQRLREKDGLSYDVGMGLSVPTQVPEQGPGLAAANISIGASFAPENRDKLLDGIRSTLSERVSKGFSAAEVDKARQAILARRADNLAQQGSVLGMIQNNARYGRDMKRYQRFTQAYERLTAEQVNAALRQYVKPDKLVDVSVGSFKR